MRAWHFLLSRQNATIVLPKSKLLASISIAASPDGPVYRCPSPRRQPGRPSFLLLDLEDLLLAYLKPCDKMKI